VKACRTLRVMCARYIISKLFSDKADVQSIDPTEKTAPPRPVSK
jgi:hypothetical protein